MRKLYVRVTPILRAGKEAGKRRRQMEEKTHKGSRQGGEKTPNSFVVSEKGERDEISPAGRHLVS